MSEALNPDAILLPDTIDSTLLRELESFAFELRSLGLNGHCGQNRVAATSLLPMHPQRDVEAIYVWLLTKAHNPHTFRSYKREAQRLLHWAGKIRRRAISDLDATDLYAFRKWMTTTEAQSCFPPRKNLRSAKASTSSVQHDSGPRSPLSAQSRRLSETILSSMFAFLKEGRYLANNPYSLLSRNVDHFGPYQELSSTAAKSLAKPEERTSGYKRDFGPEEHVIDADLYRWLLDRIDDPSTDWPKEHGEIRNAQGDALVIRPWTSARIERLRFAWIFGFWSAGRRDELCRAVMGDVVAIRGAWKWFVIGKRDKSAHVELSDAAVQALARYRTSRGLPPLPTDDVSDKDAPLLPSFVVRFNSKGVRAARPMTPGALYKEIREFAALAATWLPTQDPHQPHLNDWRRALQSCSPHWLRRSYGTASALSGVSLHKVKKQMRHARLDTTLKHYVLGDDENERPELEKIASYMEQGVQRDKR